MLVRYQGAPYFDRLALCKDLDGLCVLAHANKAVVCRYHKKAIIRLATEQAEHSGSQIPLMSGKIREAYDLGLFDRQLG